MVGQDRLGKDRPLDEGPNVVKVGNVAIRGRVGVVVGIVVKLVTAGGTCRHQGTSHRQGWCRSQTSRGGGWHEVWGT